MRRKSSTEARLVVVRVPPFLWPHSNTPVSQIIPLSCSGAHMLIYQSLEPFWIEQTNGCVTPPPVGTISESSGHSPVAQKLPLATSKQRTISTTICQPNISSSASMKSRNSRKASTSTCSHDSDD